VRRGMGLTCLAQGGIRHGTTVGGVGVRLQQLALRDDSSAMRVCSARWHAGLPAVRWWPAGADHPTMRFLCVLGSMGPHRQWERKGSRNGIAKNH